MKKNIWYISKYASDPVYGFPGRQFFFSKYLIKKDLNVTLVSSRSNGNKKIPSFKFKNKLTYKFEGINGVILNGPIIDLGINLKRIISWIDFEIRMLFWAIFAKKEKPDLIIVSSLSLLTFLSGTILKFLFKCKLICEVRDIWPLTLIETKNLRKSNIIIRYLSHLEYTGYKYADAIVGTMGNLRSHICKINPIYCDKVAYIPTGFDPSFYAMDEKALIEADNIFSQIPLKNFIIGYAGAIGLANCIDEIINLAHRMKEEPVTFLILGSGVLKNKMIEIKNQLKLDNVIFGGFFPKNIIPYFLSRCDILIHLTLANESLYDYGVSPNKWIDYMYSGRPIVVALDGYRNIINEAECGVFVKAGDLDAMINAINCYRKLDKDDLDRIGKKGRDYLLKNLTYDILSDKYKSVIAGLFYHC